jgi:hypothetical protein
VLRDLKDELLAVVLGLNGVENGRELVTVELHVDDGTNDLVNLSDGTSLRAGEPGQGRKAIGSEGLDCATSDGGRSSKSSPPEGPGKTAKSSKKPRLAGEKMGKKAIQRELAVQQTS